MRKRLTFPAQAAATALATAIHNRLVAANREYARAVSVGQIARWAFPYQDAADWCVNIKERCESVLTSSERGQVVNDGN